MKIIFILHLFFILILNGCKVNEGPRGPHGGSLWPDGPKPEEDPDSKKKKPIKVFTFEDIKAYHSKAYWDLIDTGKTDLHFQDLEQWNLEELTPDQLFMVFRWVAFYHERSSKYNIYNDFPKITPSQLQKLSVEHIKKALCVIIKYLSPAHLNAFDEQQLRALYLCIKFVTPDHIAQLDFKQIHILYGSPYVNDLQRAAIPDEYFEEYDYLRINTPEDITNLSKEYIKTRVIPYLIYHRKTHWLSCEQMSWVSTRAMAYIDPDELADIKEEQLKCIPVEKTIHNLTDEHFRELSFSQMKIFKENPKITNTVQFIERYGDNFFEIIEPEEILDYTYHIQFFEPHQFQNVPLSHAEHFPALLLSTLTPERIRNFPHYVQVLKPMRIWSFSRDQGEVLFPTCRREVCAVIALTKPQIEALTLEQMQDFDPEVLSGLWYKQVQAFSMEQLLKLNQEQLKALLSSDGNYTSLYHKFHAVMDTVEWSGGRQAEEWVENMLKPVLTELIKPPYHCDSVSDCKWFEQKMEKRAEIRKQCEEFQEDHINELPTYIRESYNELSFSMELKYKYNIKSCLSEIYNYSGYY